MFELRQRDEQFASVIEDLQGPRSWLNNMARLSRCDSLGTSPSKLNDLGRSSYELAGIVDNSATEQWKLLTCTT
ncbi:hypothetical protein RBSWK_02726 [Rhodopirellula baltica SWK14]|uniref:Uncharacterized protein n=1 Tax=Rhodopirellula baltica SWK14 TaxID=993516 RepID=L7CI70_RHOBT|nr:hypothetical protein RBSWK_02726 [Rhodopirellula baltica SWK14]